MGNSTSADEHNHGKQNGESRFSKSVSHRCKERYRIKDPVFWQTLPGGAIPTFGEEKKIGDSVTDQNPEDLTVVICCLSTSEALENLLSDLLSRELGPQDRINVVLNGPGKHDTATSLIQTVDSRLHVMHGPLGLARSRNLGLKNCSTELIAFLDDDVKLEAGWRDGVGRVFGDSRIAAAGGAVLPIWLSTKPNWLTPHHEKYLSVQVPLFAKEVLGPKDFLIGANLVFRSSLLARVGGFAEYLGRIGSSLLSNEEIPPQKHLRDSGFQIVLSNQFAVNQPVRADRLTREWMIRRLAWQAVSDALSDADQIIPIDDKQGFQSGIRFRELQDIRQTIFHLLTDGGSNYKAVGSRPTFRSKFTQARLRILYSNKSLPLLRLGKSLARISRQIIRYLSR